MHSHTRQQSGFTLIETLVAITILVIVATGIMGLLAKSIGDIDAHKNRMMAINLARDTSGSVKAETSRLLCNPIESTLNLCLSPNRCDVDYAARVVSCPATGCILSLDTNGYFTSQPGGTPTIFSRWVTLIKRTAFLPSHAGGASSGLDNEVWYEVEVQATVAWQDDGVSRSVKTSSYSYINSPPGCFDENT